MLKRTKPSPAAARTGVYALVYVERGLLREPLVTDVALEGALAGVGSHVDLEVRLAGERRRALHALVGTPLHCRAQLCISHELWEFFFW